MSAATRIDVKQWRRLAYFGFSVAINGSTAVVGALFGGAAPTGAGLRFQVVGLHVESATELTPADREPDDLFGDSVAISGNNLVVGAASAYRGKQLVSGHAYVYSVSGSTWTQQQELTAADGVAHDAFGDSVAISGDTLVVGAGSHKVGSNSFQGAAYVYTLAASTWSQLQELTAADGTSNATFGGAVALSGDTVRQPAPVIKSWEAIPFRARRTFRMYRPRRPHYRQGHDAGQCRRVTWRRSKALLAAQHSPIRWLRRLPTLQATRSGALPSPLLVLLPAQGVTYPNGNTAITNSQGQAIIDVTANTVIGSYTVTASVAGIANPASFDLTNLISLAAPVIITQPTSQTVVAGNSVTLLAAASGSPTPTVQWGVEHRQRQNLYPN